MFFLLWPYKNITIKPILYKCVVKETGHKTYLTYTCSPKKIKHQTYFTYTLVVKKNRSLQLVQKYANSIVQNIVQIGPSPERTVVQIYTN